MLLPQTRRGHSVPPRLRQPQYFLTTLTYSHVSYSPCLIRVPLVVTTKVVLAKEVLFDRIKVITECELFVYVITFKYI